MRKYLIEVIIIIMIIFMVFWAYVKFTITEQVSNHYEPYKPFSIEVSHEEWHGQLEPGRYTKSGILIIKK